VGRSSDVVEVEYDNGEVEEVDSEDVSPVDLPVDFGDEEEDLQVRSTTCRSR
jgi:hypothetical protein